MESCFVLFVLKEEGEELEVPAERKEPGSAELSNNRPAKTAVRPAKGNSSHPALTNEAGYLKLVTPTGMPAFSRSPATMAAETSR